MQHHDLKLGIVGLGYVGLPLAVEFGRKRSVIGFDINQKRIDELTSGHDLTKEVTVEELAAGSRGVEEVRELVDADSLGYLSLDGTLESTNKEKENLLTCSAHSKSFSN